MMLGKNLQMKDLNLTSHEINPIAACTISSNTGTTSVGPAGIDHDTVGWPVRGAGGYCEPGA